MWLPVLQSECSLRWQQPAAWRQARGSGPQQGWIHIIIYHLLTFFHVMPVENSSSSNSQGHHDNQVGQEGKGAEHKVGAFSKTSFDNLKQIQILISVSGPFKKVLLWRFLMCKKRFLTIAFGFLLYFISYGRIFQLRNRAKKFFSDFIFNPSKIAFKRCCINF